MERPIDADKIVDFHTLSCIHGNGKVDGSDLERLVECHVKIHVGITSITDGIEVSHTRRPLGMSPGYDKLEG